MISVKKFVLLSGGMDSATVLYTALDVCRQGTPLQSIKYVGVEALLIDYGQRHRRELSSARELCRAAKVPYTMLKLPPEILGGNALTTPSAEVPNKAYSELEGISPLYVPFRNGLFLSILASHAQRWVGDDPDRAADIYIGAHAEDAERDAYPDCSIPFIRSMADAISIGTYHSVTLRAPFIRSTKADIAEAGARLGVPFELTWSCYKGEALHCGECPTCRARKAAFKASGIDDPTEYAV